MQPDLFHRTVAKYGHTIASLAQALDVSRSTVGRWFSGDTPELGNAMRATRLVSVEDAKRLLTNWGYHEAAEGVVEARSTYDPERANGWRLEQILGEVRQLNRTLQKLDGLLRHEFTKENTNDV